MPAIRVEPVTTERARRTFVQCPWRIYIDDETGVPPLISSRLGYLDPDPSPSTSTVTQRSFWPGEVERLWHHRPLSSTTASSSTWGSLKGLWVLRNDPTSVEIRPFGKP